MTDTSKLLNLREVSEILNLNPEVLRRWLRSKKLPGIKVGSDWRVSTSDLNDFIANKNIGAPPDNQVKMCTRFPKWLEFSGLPTHLNELFGPQTWPVFKKLVEIDFELGKPTDRLLPIDLELLAQSVGYENELVKKTLNMLVKAGFLTRNSKKNQEYYSIVSPIKTPKLILDIDYRYGGVKGAPDKALTNSCLRRFLETS